MILTDADQLREALRLAVQERDDALEWAAGARVAIVKMEAQRAELRRQLAVWENASVAQLVRERDEARAEVDRLRADLSYAGRERDRWMGQVVAVAERQREACAQACEEVLEEAELKALVPGRVKTGIGAASECVDATRATPLVTEVDS